MPPGSRVPGSGRGRGPVFRALRGGPAGGRGSRRVGRGLAAAAGSAARRGARAGRVLDEVVTALDASIKAQVLNLIRDLQEVHEFAALFISTILRRFVTYHIESA